MADKTKTLLHVGPGRKYLPDLPGLFHDGTWHEVRLDTEADLNPHFIASMTDMRVVQDNFADALYSAHNIEHVFWHQVPQAFREFKRVLKPGGFLCIYCPDLQAIADRIIKGDLLSPIYESRAGPITAMDFLYGHGGSLVNGAHAMAHKCGFSAKVMFDVLEPIGFAQFGVKRIPIVHELLAIAIKGPIGDINAKELLGQLIATDNRGLVAPKR
jgi:hypothetical protein